jgi:hypothetical protein
MSRCAILSSARAASTNAHHDFPGALGEADNRCDPFWSPCLRRKNTLNKNRTAGAFVHVQSCKPILNNIA